MTVLFVLLTVVSCRQTSVEANEDHRSLTRHEFNEPQMGVPFRIVLYATDASTAARAAGAAFERIEALNAIMSDYDTDSELNRLTRTSGPGRPVRVSADLWNVLRRAQELAEQSSGAFDVTVGPYVGLWRKARREQALPKPELLADAGARVGWKKMKLHPATRSVELLVPVMHLDLGGIAKGYAVDAALRVLRSRGVNRALVSGGGDMVAGDPPPGRQGWQVKLDSGGANARKVDAGMVWLSGGAIATSGDMFQFIEVAGARYSHIVDPRTGVGLTNQSLVTVLAPDGMTADSLATTISVLGPRAGLEFARRFPGVEARVVWREANAAGQAATEGFWDRVEDLP